MDILKPFRAIRDYMNRTVVIESNAKFIETTKLKAIRNFTEHWSMPWNITTYQCTLEFENGRIIVAKKGGVHADPPSYKLGAEYSIYEENGRYFAMEKRK